MGRVRTWGLVAAVLACGAMVGGCRWLRSREEWESLTGRDDAAYVGGDLVVENGYQEGAMGEVTGHAGSTFVEQGYGYEGYTHVRLESQGRGWWVMSLIDVHGATLDDLVPGVVYRSATSGTLDDDAIDVNVTGCSGPSQGNWTYDTQASRVELEVEDLGEGLRRVHFRTWYRNGSGEQLTSGSFDYRTVR